MYPVPDVQAWRDHITSGSRRPLVRVEILDATGQVIASTATATAGVDLRIVGKPRVSMNRSDPIRRQLPAITFVDQEGVLSPLLGGTYLDNLRGHEVRVWAGFALPDGPWLVPLITCPFEDADTHVSTAVQRVTISGPDRGGRLVDPGWQGIFTLTAAEHPDVGEAAKAIVAHHLPGVPMTWRLPPDLPALPADRIDLGDGSTTPLEDVRRLLAAAALDFRFDGNGDPVAHPFPDPSTAPSVWPGDHPMIRWPVVARSSKRSAITGVAVTSDAPWLTTTLRAEVYDTNPESRTYYDPTKLDDPDLAPLMRLGKRLHEERSRYVWTQAAATELAMQLLPTKRGVEEMYDLTITADPALEEGDVVTVPIGDDPTQRVAAVLDTIDMPLAGGETRALARRRR